MSQDYGPATWIPTTHFWSGRRGYTPRWIVLHGSGGGTSADEIARAFQTDDPPTSAHYVVGLNGEVIQCVAEADSAWANGVLSAGHDPWWSPSVNPNFQTLSIEVVKPDSGNRNQLTQAQQQACFALIRQLCQKWSIPMQPADASGGITGHQSIDPVNRANCPGAYPWDALWTYLRAPGMVQPLAYQPSGMPAAPAQGLMQSAALSAPTQGLMQSGMPAAPTQLVMQSGIPAPAAPVSTPSGPSGGSVPASTPPSTAVTIPSGWRDDGQVLTAPNGLPVNLGFRWYILHHQWDSENWPLDLEQATGTVDVNNPSAGRGTIQHFRKNILVWEEATGAVYELWAGAVALTYQQRATTTANLAPASAGPAPYSQPVTWGGSAGAPLAMSIPIGTAAPLAGAGAAAAGAAAAVATALAPAPAPVSSPMPVATSMPPLSYAEPSVPVAQASPLDPLSQRVGQLEQKVHALVDGLSHNARTRKVMQQLEQKAESDVSTVLENPQVQRTILSHPRIILRLVLMVLGLIFSDVVAWAVSVLAHHSGQVPLPLLTVGTLLSGVVFLGVFSVRPHM